MHIKYIYYNNNVIIYLLKLMLFAQIHKISRRHNLLYPILLPHLQRSRIYASSQIPSKLYSCNYSLSLTFFLSTNSIIPTIIPSFFKGEQKIGSIDCTSIFSSKFSFFRISVTIYALPKLYTNPANPIFKPNFSFLPK